MKITSGRFLLRDFVSSDKEALIALLTDPFLLSRYGPEYSPRDHAESLFEKFILWSAETPRLRYQFGVYRIDSPNLLIGCCGLRGTSENQRQAEMGISLAPGYWGRYGVAVELVDALLEFGFAYLALDKVYGSTASQNTQVAKLATWFGAGQSASAAANAEHKLPQTGWEISQERWSSTRDQRRGWAISVQADWG